MGMSNSVGPSLPAVRRSPAPRPDPSTPVPFASTALAPADLGTRRRSASWLQRHGLLPRRRIRAAGTAISLQLSPLPRPASRVPHGCTSSPHPALPPDLAQRATPPLRAKPAVSHPAGGTSPPVVLRPLDPPPAIAPPPPVVEPTRPLVNGFLLLRQQGHRSPHLPHSIGPYPGSLPSADTRRLSPHLLRIALAPSPSSRLTEAGLEDEETTSPGCSTAPLASFLLPAQRNRPAQRHRPDRRRAVLMMAGIENTSSQWRI
ncbi:hypothetical protein U9M48_020908 [Paspalum notatum var. saurae]|uniref:Uncharacterized protein n=1 Tax=Paspalum notatum var. saurae TaxID=547442 RepID=A0AAQ3TEE4_PASNO